MQCAAGRQSAVSFLIRAPIEPFSEYLNLSRRSLQVEVKRSRLGDQSCCQRYSMHFLAVGIITTVFRSRFVPVPAAAKRPPSLEPTLFVWIVERNFPTTGKK